MIRRGTPADVEQLVSMGLQFIDTTVYRQFVTRDGAQLHRLVYASLEHGAVFVVDGGDRGLLGMIAVMVVPSPVCGELVGTEVAWWMQPAHRGAGTWGARLWMRGETWARSQGARWMHMVAPAGAHDVSRMYARRGYAELETTWQRELPSLVMEVANGCGS
jgi:hypothetical protein